jgi:hypothetical protein
LGGQAPPDLFSTATRLLRRVATRAVLTRGKATHCRCRRDRLHWRQALPCRPCLEDGTSSRNEMEEKEIQEEEQQPELALDMCAIREAS